MIGFSLARSLRIVVAATPPSPMAWLIWSRPSDVARRVKTGNAGALVVVDRQCPVRRDFSVDLLGELGVRVRSQRRIDAVEDMLAIGRRDRDALVHGGHRLAGAVDALDPELLHAGNVVRAEFMRAVRRDEGDVLGKAPQEHRLGDAVRPTADHAHFFVGDLIAVADRAVADETFRKRLVVEVLVHRRLAVGEAGRKQNLPGGNGAAAPFGHEAALDLVEPCHASGLDRGAVHLRLFAHQPKQLLAFDPARIAGMIVRAGNPACPALAGIDDLQRQMIAGKIDGGSEPRRPASDHQTIIIHFLHWRLARAGWLGSRPAWLFLLPGGADGKGG